MVRSMRVTGHVACTRNRKKKRKSVYNGLVGELEGRRLLKRPRRT
jgi:hypothetical protein